MAAERAIKLRLEVEASQYTKAMADAGQAAEKLAAQQDLAAKKADHASAVHKTASERVKAAEEGLKKVKADSKATSEQLSKAEQDLTKAKLDETVASQNLRDAERGLKDAKAETTAAAEKQSTVMGRFNGFMERNAEGVRAAGTMMVAFGGAITGVGLAAIKTGIEYNTMQQTTRKALTTLTGSAEEANAQMDKLDAFAKTSPFAKDTFIRAQQQMMAFGIESSKVIPYLEGINDAVAAAGGNSQSIGEISYIMAQISAASKITATDLMQFGQRGIDAATLIGSQMGMTGQEIRASITAGTLDAGVALDALAAGMSETYEGAAAGVKDTFAGAIDRLKASWREFGAMLAEPLVSQDGGGLLVDWANSAATLANNFRELPAPIRNVTLGLIGLTGVAALGAGSIFLGAPKILATKAALSAMATDAPKWTRAMKGMGLAAGAAGIALQALMISSAWDGGPATQSIEEIKAGLKDLADGATTVQTAFKNVSEQSDWSKTLWSTTVGAKDLVSVFEQLDQKTLFGGAQQGIISLKDSLGNFFKQDWRSDFDTQVADLRAYLSALAEGAASDLPAASKAFQQLNKEAGGTAESAARLLAESPELRDALIGVASGAGLATNDATLLKIAMGELDPEIDGVKTASEKAAITSEEHAKAMQAQADAADAAWDSMNRLTNGVLTARSAERDYLEALLKANEALDVNGRTLDVNTSKGRDNAEALDAIVSKGMEHVDALREQGASQEELGGTVQKVREDFIKQAEAFGMSTDEAKILADQLNLFPGVVPTKVEVETQEGAQRTKDLERYIKEMGHSLDDWIIDGETGEAVNKTNGLKYYIDGTTGEVKISAKTDAAKLMARIAQGYINRLNASINVTARVTEVRKVRNDAINKAANMFNNLWGKKDGGRADTLRGYADGGRVPYTGLGVDKVLGVDEFGTPHVRVDDREWIVNRRSSDKYDALLNAVNQDSPSVQHLAGFAGGGSAGFAPVGVPANVGGQSLDYGRLGAEFAKALSGQQGTQVTIHQTNNNPQVEPVSLQTQRVLQSVASLGDLGNV